MTDLSTMHRALPAGKGSLYGAEAGFHSCGVNMGDRISSLSWQTAARRPVGLHFLHHLQRIGCRLDGKVVQSSGAKTECKGDN